MSITSIPLWEWLWMGYSTFSALTHILILTQIVKTRLYTKSGSFFGCAFFSLCVAQGVQEILMYFTCMFINRFRKYRIIQYELADDNNIVEMEYYWFISLRNNLYTAHLLIAFNRLFSMFGIAVRFWTNRNIVIMMCLGYLFTSLPRAITFCISPPTNFKTSVDPNADIFGFTFPTSIVDTITEFVLSIGTTSICFICYYTIAVFARRKLANVNARTKTRELILLRCAVATFLMMLPATIRATLYIYALLAGNTALLLLATRQMSVVIEVMFVFQPWILLLSCPQLRDQLLLMIRPIAVAPLPQRFYQFPVATVPTS